MGYKISNRKWQVIRDLQGGSFGMNRVYDLKDWVETAVEWSMSEGNTELAKALRVMIEKVSSEEEENKTLGFIAEMWGLEFEEVENDNDQR